MVTVNIEFQRRAAALVSREVMCSMSNVVSTLASGFDNIERRNRDLANLAEQAFELARPIPDYEEAATDAGWEHQPREKDGQNVYIDKTDGQTWCARDWEALCQDHDIEPYDRDVYEHWAISSWLADKLEAKGERVDRDFAGLIVWARTTTGQAISIDSVIEEITRETGYASHDPQPVVPATTPELPWSDMKVAYGFVGDADALLDAEQAGTLRLPAGWSLNETDASGARLVVVFRVEPMPTIADGVAVEIELSRFV